MRAFSSLLLFLFILFILFILAAGCSQMAEGRLRKGLVNAGLSERNAACMAGRMVDRLSLAQLRRLEALSALNRDHMREMGLGEFIARVRQVGDPEVLAVTTSSAALCAAGIAS